jgi:hypothetical protein
MPAAIRDQMCSASAGYYSDRNAGNAIKELEVPLTAIPPVGNLSMAMLCHIFSMPITC